MEYVSFGFKNIFLGNGWLLIGHFVVLLNGLLLFVKVRNLLHCGYM